MAAPLGNSNRLGKKGQTYNLSMPRLVCDKCLAKDTCPLYKPGPTPCAIIKRVRNKAKLNTLAEVQQARRAMILDSLVQLEVHSAIAEKTGETDKNTINFRKLLLEQLKELERDMFAQERAKQAESKSTLVTALIQEVAQGKLAAPKFELPDVINAEYEVTDAETVEPEGEA